MKCENCGHLAVDGYEYPESYCELWVPDNPKYAKYLTDDGCSLTKIQRINLCREINDSIGEGNLIWDESKQGNKNECI